MRVGKTKLKLSLTEEGREGKSKVIASSKFLESKLLKLCKDEGIGNSRRVEYLRLDVMNQTKKRERENGRNVRRGLVSSNRQKNFRKADMGSGIINVLRMGVVPGRVWGSEAPGMTPTHGEVLRKQMASAAGRKLSVSISSLGHRARASVCSYVLFGASSLEGAM